MADQVSAGSVPETKAVAFSALKPQVVVPSQKAEEAVAFYKEAFGAEEVKRSAYPKRKADQEQPLLLCAELKIGGSSFIVCDQSDDSSPVNEVEGKGAAGSGIVFCLETDEVAGAASKAISAGAFSIGEESGEGECKVKDPFGVVWLIGKKSCSAVAAADDEIDA